MIRTGNPLDILLVEDNPGDVALVTHALEDEGEQHSLHVVTDGTDALKFLHGRNEYAGTPRPDLVLLDLNLPLLDGNTVLTEIKTNQALQPIPVVFLTSSTDRDDIHSAYDLHANAYLTKSTDPFTFMRMIRDCVQFWSLTTQVVTGTSKPPQDRSSVSSDP